MNSLTVSTFFIDISLGKKEVAEVLRNAGANVEIHAEHFALDEEDAVWLSEVAQRGWIILTKDQKIAYRTLEQVAIAQANGRVFALSSGDISGAAMAAAFKKALSKIERFAKGHPSPFIAKVYKTGRVAAWIDRNKLLKTLKSLSPPKP